MMNVLPKLPPCSNSLNRTLIKGFDLALTIIKLGGSLMQAPELNDWVKAIMQTAKDEAIIIVPGGGAFVDNIRALQLRLQFDDVLAHKLALLGMCQFGYYVASVNPAIPITSDLNVLKNRRKQGVPYLWLPQVLLDDDTALPPSWDYSADSIALWLAIQCLATRLVLVKSIAIDHAATLQDLIAHQAIDPGFQTLRDDYTGKIIWFEKSEYGKLKPCFFDSDNAGIKVL